jgi:hypothetical protein
VRWNTLSTTINLLASLNLLEQMRFLEIAALWASIDESLPTLDPEDRDAIQQALRRDAELASGQAAGRSHEQVMDAARRVLG